MHIRNLLSEESDCTYAYDGSQSEGAAGATRAIYKGVRSGQLQIVRTYYTNSIAGIVDVREGRYQPELLSIFEDVVETTVQGRFIGYAADEVPEALKVGPFLPDAWQLQHFGRIGINPYVQAPSGHGTIWENYIHGTNPLVADGNGSGIPDVDEAKLGVTQQNKDAIVYDNNSMIIGITGKFTPIVRDAEGNITSFTKAN